MMVRVNLAQESPVGISVKNPGGARFPGITWDWLTTQNPGSLGEAGDGARGPNIQVLCALLTAATHLGSCQLLQPTLLPVVYISSPASSSARHIQEEAGQGVFLAHFRVLRGVLTAAGGAALCSAVSRRCGGAGGLPQQPLTGRWLG